MSLSSVRERTDIHLLIKKIPDFLRFLTSESLSWRSLSCCWFAGFMFGHHSVDLFFTTDCPCFGSEEQQVETARMESYDSLIDLLKRKDHRGLFRWYSFYCENCWQLIPPEHRDEFIEGIICSWEAKSCVRGGNE